jgi:hypothetical protein
VAQIIDMDEGLLDGVYAMTTFFKFNASERYFSSAFDD